MGGKDSKQQRDYRPHRNDRRPKRDLDFSACPARVENIKISGLGRTRDDYVNRLGNGLFQAKTFKDVLLECNKARTYLNDLGIYKDIHVLIDVSRGPNASINGYEITFSGTELSRILGTVGTEVGQNEGSLTIELSSPNLWGRGERVIVQGSYSNSKTTDLSMKLMKPFYHTKFGDYKPDFSLGLFRHTTLVPVSSYKSASSGLLAELNCILPLAHQHVHNTLQYEMSFREISTLNKRSPFFVREYCGPRMVSLLRHIITWDQRDSSIFPTNGFHAKITSEYCGLGGNTSYLSGNCHAELNVPLFSGLSAQLTSRLGIIHNNNKNNPTPSIGSLYILGGPLTIRGFQYGGVGPHSESFAMGAHTYWATALHLWAPLPFNKYLGRFGNNFRMHAFYNCGNCNTYTTDKMRSAAGIGVAIRLIERARIEFNYCYPLLKQPGDIPQPGFQFGIGYEFL